MSSRINSQTSDVPIARVDAQDPEQALPIREYLEQNGVAVVLGRKPALLQTYHIICGDAEFVKETLAKLGSYSIRPFIVLFLPHEQTVPEDFVGINAKIAAVTGNRLPARDVSTIFAYFFTGGEPVLYLDAIPRPMVEMKPIADEGKKGEVREKRKRKKKIGFVKIFLFAFVLLVAPVVWYLVSVGMIVGLQWYGIAAARQGNVGRLPLVASATSSWVGQGRAALAVIGAPAGVLGASSTIRSHERFLSIMNDVAGAQEKLVAIASESKELAAALFSPSETPIPARVDRVRLMLEEVADALGLAGAQLRLIEEDPAFPFGRARVRRLVRGAQEEANRALGWMGDGRNLLALYRIAGGFDRKKTYLVLLQNSMELRPTGGFIGSVATVNVEEGRLETPVVQDVYALDGQLKGHVDPPPPIRDVLGQEHWYLRDSNWDPDFAVSGAKAAWFYEKETGQTVDGVIAVTTNVLTDLLGVTGPIDLPDYNDRVTRENFFGKSLFYTKADFFPGSTQKKDFLGSLATAVLGKVTTSGQADAARVASVLMSALRSGEIQVWFADGGARTIADSAGWTGSVAPIALVESNMGVNKVNFFINRAIKSRVDIEEDGAVTGMLAITYQNTSTNDATISGGGIYLNYLRSYLPPDALILSVTLDGTEVSHQDETTGGSAVTGLAFTVPPGGTRTVGITYRRGVPVAFTQSSAHIAVSFRKQPGVRDTTLDLSIGYPAGWKTKESSNAFANIREVRYNTTLDQTKTFELTISK